MTNTTTAEEKTAARACFARFFRVRVGVGVKRLGIGLRLGLALS